MSPSSEHPPPEPDPAAPARFDPRSIEDAFDGAARLPTLERAAFLDELRKRDAALADEVESLLRYHAGGELPGGDPLLGQTVGGCRLERLVGSGGMSVVYAATQELPRRRVAVKIIRPERMSPSASRRLRVEAEALARLEHPNVARVYAAGSFTPTDRSHEGADGGEALPFIVLELVDGAVPVNRWADAHRLAPRARIELVAAVADAVAHAHRAGVIHRDLKPGNVVVGSDGIPKVIDFGIAAVADSTVTMATEGPMGTLAYMSPEQARGGAAETRSDVWGLGALLYDLLTGRPPFDVGNRSIASQVDRLLHEAPSPAIALATNERGADFAAAIPPATDAVLAKALSTDVERRYRSAAEFADELRRLVRGEPLLVRPDSEWDAVRRVCRRHRTAIVTGSAIAVAVIGALLVSLALLGREREAHARAESAAYLASIVAAGAMLDREDASAARAMLERSPERFRGWEWRHLSGRADQASWRVDMGKDQQVYGSDYSPDGRVLFAAASSHVAAVDPVERRVLWLREGEPGSQSGPYWRVKALSSGDAIFVRLAASLERRDRSGEVRARVEDPMVGDVALDATETRLFTTGANGFSERDPVTLERRRFVEAKPPLREFARALTVLPDASLVILGDVSGRVTALDATTGETAWTWDVPGPAAEVRGVARSPDGTRIAAVGGPYLAMLDARTGKPVWEQSTGGRVFRSPAFSADGRELLVATWVEAIDRLDARDGRRLGSASGIYSQVWTISTSPDGTGFAAGGLSAALTTFPPDASTEPRAIALDGEPVRSVAAGRGATAGSTFASTDAGALFGVDLSKHVASRLECGLAVRSVRTTPAGVPLVAHDGGVAWLDPADEGRRAGRVEVTEQVALPRPARLATPVGERHAVVIASIDPLRDAAYLVERARDDGSGPRVWELPARGLACGHGSPTRVPGTFYLPAGQQGAVLLVRFLDADGRPLDPPVTTEVEGQPEYTMTAALSPDGRQLALGAVLNSGEVTIVDPSTFVERLRMPNHRGIVRALAWSPDGTRLASRATDDTLRIWDVARGLDVLTAWRGLVNDLAWADDDSLWAACADGQLRVFGTR